MKRQGLTITIKKLIKLTNELCNEKSWDTCGVEVDRKFQINIINKSGDSDGWEIEDEEKCLCNPDDRTYCEKHYKEMYGGEE